MTNTDLAEPLDPVLRASLTSALAYPHDPSAADGVIEIQTHLSHVFLTGARVYKIRKAVDLGFVSFLARSARNRDCLREVVLNRRLSPDVYFGIAAVERRNGGFSVGEIEPNPSALPALEHCVVMRRLAAGRDASSLVDANALRPEWLDAVAQRIAAFHARQNLGRPSPFSPEEWLARIWRPVGANFESLHEHRIETVGTEGIDALRDRATAAFERLRPRFEARRAEGRAVDAHGDLHLEHVWFETDDSAPLFIDCLEFDDELRRIDAASEIAFLAMDLGFRGRRDLAERLLAAYARAADDFGLYHVVDFFMSYRAAVRGKVEAIAALDPRIPKEQRRRSMELARRHVSFATTALDARPPGVVFKVGGIIGAGKSSVARALADETHGVVISSDEVRKVPAVAGPQATGAAEWRRGRYAPAEIARIYDEMLSRAEAVVASGRAVILDASWARADRREHARNWAAKLGCRSIFLEVRCSRKETLARLERRSLEGTDPSEAGPEIYDAFVAAFDSLREDEWPLADHWTVDTGREAWREELRQHVDIQETRDV